MRVARELSTVLNVIGQPVDNLATSNHERYPIHRHAPTFEDSRLNCRCLKRQKVIDLIQPFVRGG